MKSGTSRIRSWGRLLRLPNLLTVPGDPLIGFLLVTQGNEGLFPGIWAAAASLCFYAVGLILNDLSDIETDRSERPDRPLPSGHIRPAAAAVAVFILLGVGQIFCCLLDPQAWWIGFILVLSIFLYDIGVKSIPVIGPLNMGACRGLSVLLGASAVPATDPFPPALILAVATLTAYIAAVTQIARHEMAAAPSAASRPFLVGLLISVLLFIQAGFILVAGAGTSGLLIGLILIGLWPLHRIFEKRFPAS